MSRRDRASDPFMWLDTSVAQNVSALLLAEFSAEVAPQTSLRRSFEHARTLGVSAVRDYLHLASATVAVWAQRAWPQNWRHRGNNANEHFGSIFGATVQTSHTFQI